MTLQKSDLITKGLEFIREDGQSVGTLYEEGLFYPTLRREAEYAKFEGLLYTDEMAEIIKTHKNFNQIYNGLQ